MIKILKQDNLKFLNSEPDNSYDLIYIDPPFNTGEEREIHGVSYSDKFDDYENFILPRLKEAHRLLKMTGSLFVHLDHHEVHYVKVWLDKIFGRDNFRNEIIWAYDYGGKPKNKWANKHDNILWYSRTSNYTFNYEAIDRIPYMAPSLVGAEKAERGKVPTDTWWNTIVPTNGKERVNYPTQKPLSILERIVTVHSNEPDKCLDFFAGSGSFGVACSKYGRDCVLVDKNEEAIEIMNKRLSDCLDDESAKGGASEDWSDL